MATTNIEPALPEPGGVLVIGQGDPTFVDPMGARDRACAQNAMDSN